MEIAPTPAPFSNDPSHQRVSERLNSISIAIALIIGAGVLIIIPNPTALIQVFSVLLFSPAVVSLLVVVALIRLFMSISLREGRKVLHDKQNLKLAFSHAVAVYILLVTLVLAIADFGLTHAVKSVSQDIQFVLSLFSSATFIGSIVAFYAGLIYCTARLRKGLGEEKQPAQTNPLRPEFNKPYVTIAVAAAILFYAFGGMTVIARVTDAATLCKLTYASKVRDDCFLDVAAVSGSDAYPGFKVVKTPYVQMRNLVDVGGKLAYAAKNEDGTEVVVHGDYVSPAYSEVRDIEEVGGTLAYEAYTAERGKSFIVYNGQEVGTQYDWARDPEEVGGKLAYIAEENGRRFVVWEGKEYGRGYKNINYIIDVGGKLAFVGQDDAGYQYAVLDGQIVSGGPSLITNAGEEEGQLVYLQVIGSAKGNKTILKSGAQIFGTEYDSVRPTVAFFDNPKGGKDLTFAAVKNGEVIIVRDGSEIRTGSAEVLGPYNLKGQLAYVAKGADEKYQLFVDQKPVGEKLGHVGNVFLSEGGRIALLAGENSILVDGKEVCNGRCGPPAGFYGEKFLFWGKERDGTDYLSYDGRKFGQGFYGYNYFALVNGKLHVAAFDSGVKYSIIAEQ
jgi:hypothetical protein